MQALFTNSNGRAAVIAAASLITKAYTTKAAENRLPLIFLLNYNIFLFIALTMASYAQKSLLTSVGKTFNSSLPSAAK